MLFELAGVGECIKLHLCIRIQRSAISGNALPMPPELMELYNLYKMEIETRETNENDQNLLVEAEKILRVSGFFLVVNRKSFGQNRKS